MKHDHHTYWNHDEIRVGDFITIDYGYEYCIVLKLFFDEIESERWGWNPEPGPGVFAYSYRTGGHRLFTDKNPSI